MEFIVEENGIMTIWENGRIIGFLTPEGELERLPGWYL